MKSMKVIEYRGNVISYVGATDNGIMKYSPYDQMTVQQTLDQSKDIYWCRGGRAFKTADLKMWKALPGITRQSESFTIFKSKLKTHLFGKFFSNNNRTIYIRT